MNTSLAIWLICATAATDPTARQPVPTAPDHVLRQSAAGDVVVVCPPSLRDALGAWLEHRRSQGYHPVLISNRGEPEDIRREIRDAAAKGRLAAVVLVGDVQHPGNANAELRAASVPTRHVPAKVNVLWGSEPEIATDDWFADLDDDGLPDVPIGRLSADTPDELAAIVRKTLDYERARPGPWQRRINIVAGVGGFGVLADAAIESAARTLITSGIPTGYETTMTYGRWQSPYCPDLRQFHRVTLDRLGEDSMFWVYAGHGSRRWLDSIPVPGARYRGLATHDLDDLKPRAAPPIALLFACYTGAFDDEQDCLAEHMLRHPYGPVAVWSGSRVTMPYAMSVLASELIGQTFGARPPTLGQSVLVAKRNLVRDAPNRRLLDALARLVSPSGSTPQDERLEHVHLFNLLGDPLLRIPQPATVTVDVAATSRPGQSLEVTGTTEVAGTAIVELVVRRDRLTFEPPVRRRFDPSDDALSAYDEVYRKANDPRLASTSAAVVDGRFSAQLEVPAAAHGSCHVRVFITGETQAAIGAADVMIEP